GRTMVLVGLGGVAVGLLLFFLVLVVTGPKSAEQAAQATFKVGAAESLAKTVDRSGPLLFQDLLNRSRDIYVQNVGNDEWRAFEAHAPGAPRRCSLRWEPGPRHFVDPCDGRIYPPDGTGLTQYRAFVDGKGALVVDLSSPPASSTTIP
ncbi:MAG: hypothetical protein ACRD12_10495, partial [Acidimicrobiales bacterium]